MTIEQTKRISQLEAAKQFGWSIDTLKRRIKDGTVSLKIYKDGKTQQSKAYCYNDEVIVALESLRETRKFAS